MKPTGERGGICCSGRALFVAVSMFVGAGAGAVAGCGQSGEQPSPPGAGRAEGVPGVSPGSGAGSAAAAPIPDVPPSEFVARLRLDWPRSVEQAALAATPLSTVAEGLLGDAQGAGLVELTALRAAYVQRQDPPHFAAPDGLAPAGAALLAAVAAATDHALDPTRFAPERATALVAALAQAQQAYTALPPLPPPPDAAALTKALSATGLAPGDPRTTTQVVARLAGEQGSPALRQAFAERQRLLGARQQAQARLELALADTFLRYARVLRDGNVKRELAQQERARQGAKLERQDSDAEPGDRPAVEEEPAPVAARTAEEFVQAKLLAHLGRIQDEASARQVLRELVPLAPQYTGLLAELKRYRQIAASGGWAPVQGHTVKVGPGMGKSLTTALQERLAREGYYAGAADGVFSEALGQAISQYQRTHQLAEERELSKMFWTSLNVPVADRLARLEVTLQRWRETQLGDDPNYVFVNIADFSAEVWSAGQRLFRTKVIAGNRDLRCDERSRRMVHGYATPIFSAMISYLVFAPSWSVPPRIKQEELDVQREKDPHYFEKEGFEVLNPGTSAEAARQLPGPDNSLGFIKFVFPNRHAVYMHDTPAKGLFQLPIRAFSHGCMRLEDPMGMARTLLTTDGQWDEGRFTDLYDKWKKLNFSGLKGHFDASVYEGLRKRARALERSVVLRQPIPVHIEYYTVRIDDDGRANFLADPYGYDQQLLNPTEPRSCTPDSDRALAAFGGTIAELERIEERLGQHASEGERLAAVARSAGGDPKRAPRNRALADQIELTTSQARTLGTQIRSLFETISGGGDSEDAPDGATPAKTRQRDRRAGARKEAVLKLKRMVDELRKMDRQLARQLEELQGRLGARVGEAAATGDAAPAPAAAAAAAPSAAAGATDGAPAAAVTPAPPAGERLVPAVGGGQPQ